MRRMSWNVVSAYIAGIVTGAVALSLLGQVAQAADAQVAKEKPAPKSSPDAGSAKRGQVTGIGGIFFKAKDPKKLEAWYVENLGLPKQQYGVQFHWHQNSDPTQEASTMWSTFKEDSTYFEPTVARFMINYRVDDLNAVRNHLKEIGAKVDEKVDVETYGLFSWAVDPEGNRFELWEPTPGH